MRRTQHSTGLLSDEDVTRAREMAEGERPFVVSGLLEKLSRLDGRTRSMLPPRARLCLGLYEGARRRVEALRDSSQPETREV